MLGKVKIGSTCCWHPTSKKFNSYGHPGCSCGYAIVYIAHNIQNGEKVAIKKLTARDEKSSAIIYYEMSMLKDLSGHPNIINFVSFIQLSPNDYCLITEYCSGGELVDILKLKGQLFPKETILQILYQTCQAVLHMHSHHPTIIHRDLKIENLLVSENSVIKLCDFGSCTTKRYFPDINWTRENRENLREELEKITTPSYRAPEMIDLYSNYPIHEAADIWALGCIIYLLCYNVHPFQEAAKLAILNASYSFPQGNVQFLDFQNLIYQALLIEPDQRPKIQEIIGDLQAMGSAYNVLLSGPVMMLGEPLVKKSAAASRKAGSHAGNYATPKKKTPQHQTTPFETQQPAANSTTSSYPSLDGFNAAEFSTNGCSASAGSTTPAWSPLDSEYGTADPPSVVPLTTADKKKTWAPLIDHGAGRMQRAASQALPTAPPSDSTLYSATSSQPPLPPPVSRQRPYPKQPPVVFIKERMRVPLPPTPGEAGDHNQVPSDMIYITSRLAVTRVQPQDSGQMANLERFLDNRHPQLYMVFNLTGQRYNPTTLFHGHTQQLQLKSSLFSLVTTTLELLDWLLLDPGRVVVLHGAGGRLSAAWLSVCAAVLCVARQARHPEQALNQIAVHSVGAQPPLLPSNLRYLKYVCQLADTPPLLPHEKRLHLDAVTIQPVPLFNRTKDGCRPYLEVYQGEEMLFSSASDFESMKVYSTDHGLIRFPLNGISVLGDIHIAIYHARSPLVAKAASAKTNQTSICQFHIHSGFIPEDCTEFYLMKTELDILAPASFYPDCFCVSLSLTVSDRSAPRSHTAPLPPWESTTFARACPDLLNSAYDPEPVEDDPPLANVDVPIEDENTAFSDEDYDSSFSNTDEDSQQSEPATNSSAQPTNQYINLCETKEEPLIGDLLNSSPVEKDQHPVLPTSDPCIDILLDVLTEERMPSNSQNNGSFTRAGSMPRSFTADPVSMPTDTPLTAPIKPQPAASTATTTGAGQNTFGGSMGSIPTTAGFVDPFADLFSDFMKKADVKSPPSTASTNGAPSSSTAPPPKIIPPPVTKPKPRGVFTPQPASTKATVPPDFSDLLNDSFVSGNTPSVPKTLADLQREALLEQYGPNKLQVMDWTKGKQRNLRALLSSVHTIKWPEAKLPVVSMALLLTPEGVKKQYKTIARIVHPDKWMGTPHADLAHLVFIELNDANTVFDEE